MRQDSSRRLCRRAGTLTQAQGRDLDHLGLVRMFAAKRCQLSLLLQRGLELLAEFCIERTQADDLLTEGAV